MDIGDPQRVHRIEPAKSPIPEREPATPDPIPQRAPRKEPAEKPSPRRAPTKVPAR